MEGTVTCIVIASNTYSVSLVQCCFVVHYESEATNMHMCNPLPQHTCNVKQCHHRSGVFHAHGFSSVAASAGIAAAGHLAQLSGESVRAWCRLAVWFQSLRPQGSHDCLKW